MDKLWKSIIRPAIELVSAKTLVEIGAAHGKNTRKLLEYACEVEGTVHVIDPQPLFDTEEWQIKYGNHLVLHRDLSLNGLSTLTDYDVLLIDGDHNWYTVYHELLIAERNAQHGTFPLVFLHDTGWPYGRRDSYWNVDIIPASHCHPYEKKGLVPGQSALSDDNGFNASMNNAVYEHSINNGVLTAIEDFLKQTTLSLDFINIPGFHGLGILAPAILLKQYPKLATFLSQITVSTPLLKYIKDIEHARTELISHQYSLEMTGDKLLSELHTEQDELEKEKRIHKRQKHIATIERQRVQKERDAERLERQRVQKERDAEQREMQREREKFLSQQETLEQTIHHIFQTRSWRITAPLRTTAKKIRSMRTNFMYALFGALKDLWTDFGKPCPRAVFYVRHRLLSKKWPVREQQETLLQASSEQKSALHEKQTEPKHVEDVVVVIPCHNYGHFLTDAIESVLAQTVKPKEILVVDDSSADNTAEIASRYADRGVRYIRGEWRSVGNARNAGLKETNSIYLVFLDADNMLHPDYLHHGLQTLEENPNAAIAYCNLQHFGEDDTLRMFPDTFDWQRFEYHNHIDACAILRRDSLMQVGGFSHGIDQDGDWVTWRRILKLGWQAVKSNGLCLYRIHSDNMSHKLKEKGYAKRSGFLEEEATLCITLNKADLSSWQQTAAFLQRQTYPHKSVHLVIIDNSNNAQLKQAVRNTLEVIDYGSYTYLQEPLAMAQNVPENLADSVLLSRNLNRLAQMVPEGLVFLLAEDVIPPDNIFNTLIEHFSCDILSVSGVVKPENGRTTLVWNWTHKGAPSYINKGKSVEDVGGAGIDCTVMRSAFLRNSIFHAGNPHMDPMLNFYSQFGSKQGKKSLVDWSAICTLSQERIS